MMKLHVPAISCLSKGAQISNSEKLRFVVLSPWHEKLTNTHPSVDTGVGVGSSIDVGAPSIDVGTGVGVDNGEGVASYPDPSSGINMGSDVDAGVSVVTGDGLDAVIVAVFCAKV